MDWNDLVHITGKRQIKEEAGHLLRWMQRESSKEQEQLLHSGKDIVWIEMHNQFNKSKDQKIRRRTQGRLFVVELPITVWLLKSRLDRQNEKSPRKGSYYLVSMWVYICLRSFNKLGKFDQHNGETHRRTSHFQQKLFSLYC